MCELAAAPAKRGRPAGQTKASGASVSPGRPAAQRDTDEQARYHHWRQWWSQRPGGQPSARELAGRMAEKPRTVQAYAAGSRFPPNAALANLESLSAAYGYEPLTADHLFL